ncbi:methylation-associated defense system protein kinase MAD6 [Methanosphaerula subterraneus]|uniref:methylation-associated defense system protein kinase MAD6 n=1 Tax=Methanosphaerula subterraneus TaxID=3350244 RepID=UPI003F86CD20
MTATIIPIGKPQNEGEKRAIAFLRDKLSPEYTIIHNFEVKQGSQQFEIDLGIITPYAIFLIDVKNVKGRIRSDGRQWTPEGRESYSSPVQKIRMNARIFKSFIIDNRPDLYELEKIWVEGLVLLTSPDAEFQDIRTSQGRGDASSSSDTEEWSVVKLDDSIASITNPKRIPERFLKSITKFRNSIKNSIVRGVKEPDSKKIFNDWIVQETLSSSPKREDCRAYNQIAGPNAGTVLLQVYKVDPYLSDTEQKAERSFIKIAYKALSNLPAHPNIIGVRDIFSVDEDSKYVLVLEDVRGISLKERESDLARPITLDKKIGIATELLGALVHAHAHGVVHRNLTPSAIILSEEGSLKLVGFDYAHVGGASSFSIVNILPKYLDETTYCAPEIRFSPISLGPSSDLFSAGIVLYELFTGEVPFRSFNDMEAAHAVFPESASIRCPGLPDGVDAWLAGLCCYNSKERPDTQKAFETWLGLVKPAAPSPSPTNTISDIENIPRETVFLTKYRIMEPLGKPGAFGVVYRAFDTFANQNRAIKFIYKDRISTLDRLKQEYRSLINIPGHKRIVRIYDANLTPEKIPYLVFQYLEGSDLAHLIAETPFSPDQVLTLAKQVTEGLIHIHENGVYHCDIKPSNILWTRDGAVLIDFNVSTRPESEGDLGGGTRRYLPPDFDFTVSPDDRINADRDLYALGITLYQALVGGRSYPWKTDVPPPDILPRDPADMLKRSDLSPRFVKVLTQLIAPRRADRFASACDLFNEIDKISSAFQSIKPACPETQTNGSQGVEDRNNRNGFVDALVSFYSMSSTSNAGTRGLNKDAQKVYVKTALDEQLLPAVMKGDYQLVIITGNAGDGKTAFLQQIENKAEGYGISIDKSSPIGGIAFNVDERQYLINYDGSEDKGDLDNEDVLSQFFAPFEGNDSTSWPKDLARMIAINEGRLRDFLTKNAKKFPALRGIVDIGLRTGQEQDGIIVINLNIRSVVAPGVDGEESIFTQLLKKMVDAKNWDACSDCDLADRCYIYHNVLTLNDLTAGSQVVHRLETLYALTHLRDVYHITLRDLRSALSYLITSNRTCQMVHELYESDRTTEILDSYYYSSWMGGYLNIRSSDRLLSRLALVDMGLTPDAELDRYIEFRPIGSDQNHFSFQRRSDYELKVLTQFQQNAPRDPIPTNEGDRMTLHRRFLEYAKRRTYFEQRGEQWKNLLPYHYGIELLSLISNPSEEKLQSTLRSLISAITRGEKGVNREENFEMMLQVTPTPKGSIRSYRVFPFGKFRLDLLDPGSEASYIEHTPTGLRLKYLRPTGDDPYTLEIKLDIFEMLNRLNEGYTPTVEQQQGFALQLDVFKNLLASAPYQELLITKTGHEFYRIQRENDGQIRLSPLKENCL